MASANHPKYWLESIAGRVSDEAYAGARKFVNYGDYLVALRKRETPGREKVSGEG